MRTRDGSRSSQAVASRDAMDTLAMLYPDFQMRVAQDERFFDVCVCSARNYNSASHRAAAAAIAFWTDWPAALLTRSHLQHDDLA